MEKTKIGLSVNIVAAIALLFALFGNSLALVLVVGYVLIAESDLWLKKTVVKALFVSLLFSLIYLVIGFIPTLVDFIEEIVRFFNVGFSIPVIDSVIYIIRGIFLSTIEKLVFLFMAFMAFSKKDIKIAPIDDFIDKHMA